MSAVLAALRIARRNAWRSRGRSALIMVMIGLPVLVITTVLTLVETMSVSPREGLMAALGAADARLMQAPGGTVLHQQPDGTSWDTSGGGANTAGRSAADVAALLGPGTRLIPLRHRRAPIGLAALTATVVAVGIGTYSAYMDERNAYTSARPTGMLAIWAGTIGDPAWSRLRSEAVRRLPGVPLAAGYQVKDAQGHRYALRYTVRWNGIRTRRTAAVGDRTLLRLLQGRDDPRAAAALAGGKAVVFDAAALRDGKLALRASSTSGPARRLEVPAVPATPADEHQSGALLPRGLVEQAGFSTAERQLYAMYRPSPQSTLARDLAKVTPRVTVASEEGYRNVPDPSLWGWLGGALVLVVGGTLAATRLAAADMRPEQATMLAIGAPPTMLRTVVAGQALYISGLGALVGLLAGTVTGLALTRPMTTHGAGDPVTIAVPWPFLVAVVVGLPVLASAAALVIRTGPPLARRLL
ncbi:ABC transporter permease [Nonomuraea sp. SMC257]|uniref:ABC transporter permease n=1 Tax=Nonomuraea montanisoli TaxID=2741721 RepID=A0A7Y6IHI0_9ACTN|nr:ABC transporter permease [Nonomuraea montanisoli]NUW37778.1 ABC transporter permease [Nonomuraea montanisoli]